MADFDPRCEFSISVPEPMAQDLMDILDPKVILGTGCRVIKHPGCCIICASNEDCSLIPRHVNCRCRPSPYLEFFED